MCVPVTVLGTPMGVVHTAGPAGQLPGASARAAVEALAEQAGSRIGVLRAMAASELQATTDPLTGLLNRRSLEAELTALRDRHAEYAVAFIDLDHFKVLNDTHGHETGDRALRSFARLLRREVRDADLVCRYGGEEFVVVFPEATVVDAEPIVERLVASLSESVRSGDVPAFTISVGLSDSETSVGHAEAIRHADEAMFRAKQAGRDRIVRSEPPARNSAAGRHSVPEHTAFPKRRAIPMQLGTRACTRWPAAERSVHLAGSPIRPCCHMAHDVAPRRCSTGAASSGVAASDT